jgi:plasmid stabilization system protein ParE
VTARELTWTAVARQELAEIGEFIARDKPIAANRWVETLMAAADERLRCHSPVAVYPNSTATISAR